MDRRRFVAGSAAAAAALAATRRSRQDAYPSRPVTLINPFPPGGAADVVGRPFAAALEPLLKQPVVIETKAGAAGAVGAQFAASAKPDGYTLLVHIVSISGFAEVDKLFGRTPKFTRADFIPIARFTEGPMVLVVNDQQPYKTLKELVDDAKKPPNGSIFSSSRLYGALHLPTAAVHEGGRHQMSHLPTNGGGPALTAILGNNSQVLVSSVAAASAQIKAGKIKALASFSDKRARIAAERADLEGARLSTSSSTLWVGLFAPKGTPDAVIAKLRAESQEGGRQRAVPAPRSTTSATRSPTSTSPSSPSSGTQDAQRVEAAIRRSARCEDARERGRRSSGKRMILRRDHIAGGVFVAAGALVFALSDDLPFGTLASPGAGMLPMLVLALMMAVRRDPADARS